MHLVKIVGEPIEGQWPSDLRQCAVFLRQMATRIGGSSDNVRVQDGSPDRIVVVCEPALAEAWRRHLQVFCAVEAPRQVDESYHQPGVWTISTYSPETSAEVLAL